jgi:PDZ domain-containing protein
MALSRVTAILAAAIMSATWGAGDGSASHVVHLPISAAVKAETGSGFNIIVMSWDQEGAPNPLRLQWGHSQVPVRGAGLGPLAGAFDYAVNRLGPLYRPTGTLSLSTLSEVPTSSEGPSAGAALAVGFLAVLKGERLISGIALTGTLEPTGRIGFVTRVTEKMKAAARSGYRILLVPRGQLPAPRITLARMGAESNLILREVGTVDEAYEIMTGKKL